MTASRKTFVGSVVDFSNLQVVLATSTALFRYYDVIFSLALSCIASNQDRQKLQMLKSEHLVELNMMDGSYVLGTVKILKPRARAVDTSLVKALLHK